MKATRRNFIQTLGVGAIGLTVPKTSFGNTPPHDINIDEDQKNSPKKILQVKLNDVT